LRQRRWRQRDGEAATNAGEAPAVHEVRLDTRQIVGVV
jgi:hypothetical protein